MKLSTTEAGSPDRKFSSRLRALLPRGRRKSHRLSANVTGEEDWEVDEPQIRMSRAFAVMLILHLVAVGGLFAFHMFGKDDREIEGTATRNAHAASPPPPVAPVRPNVAPVLAPRAEIVRESASGSGQVQHLMASGDSKLVIAAKFGITVRELEEANPDKQFAPGETLDIPQHSRVIGALADAAAPVNPPLALIVATPSEDVAQQEFALKKEDNPYAPVDADELPTPRPQVAPARVTQVKAEPVLEVEEAETQEEEREVAVTRPTRKPAAAPLPPAPPAAKPKPATGSRSHVIQKGDTIYNVARRYGLSPNEVMRANGISDPSRLQMGQVLKITVKR